MTSLDDSTKLGLSFENKGFGSSKTSDKTKVEENMIITLEPSIEMDENKILVQEQNLIITNDSY